MSDTTVLEPLYDRVVIEPAEKETAGGIVIPDTVKNDVPQEGTVVAVGPGKLDNSGNRMPMNVSVGTRVLFGKYSGDDVELDGKKYKIVHEDSILAIVKK